MEGSYRDEVDQVQFTIYMALVRLSDLIETVKDHGDPMYWPQGALVSAARGLVNAEAARESYLKGQYDKALVEAQVAAWDILRMPRNNKLKTNGRYGLPTEGEMRSHMGETPPS